jgi:hypothetical protein
VWGELGQSPYSPSDVKARHDKMVELVDRMLDPSTGSGQALHKQLTRSLESVCW